MNTFVLVETVDNEKYHVEVYESTLYTINVIRRKEFSYYNVEVKRKENIPFVPYVYVKFEDDDHNFTLEVQTTSYGSLGISEYIYFLDIQKQVLQFTTDLDILLTEKFKNI